MRGKSCLLVVSMFAFASLAPAGQPEKPEHGDALLGSVSSTVHTFVGTGVGAIPDGLAGTPPAYGPPLVISIPVSGITGSALSYTVGVNLTHTWVGDVDMVLRAPGGAPAFPIVSRIGVTTAGSFGDSSNYGGPYYFRDGGGPDNIWTIATGGTCGDACTVGPTGYDPTAPGETGQTNPPPVTSLDTTFAGITPAQVNGTWTLTIRDAGLQDTGTVTSAYLSIIGPSGKGDFNLDGQSDIIYRSVANGAQNKVWLMNGTTRISEMALFPDAASADWLIRGADDFDSGASPGSGKDGRTDVVMWNQTTGAVQFWLMNGVNRVVAPVALTGADPLPTNWDLSATADFDGDRKPDIVWRDFNTQNIVIWTMNGTTKVGNIVPTPGQAVNFNWIVVGAADYNDDSFTDFLWYNFSSGKIVTWYMNSAVVRTSGQFTAPDAAGNNNWKVVASADYSRRDAVSSPPLGSPDIIWRNATSGNQVIWHMDFASTRTNGQFTTPGANSPALDWVIVGPR